MTPAALFLPPARSLPLPLPAWHLCHDRPACGSGSGRATAWLASLAPGQVGAAPAAVWESAPSPRLRCRDVKQFKETRKEFERGSESLSSALHHNADVPRRRHHEAEEAMAALRTARTAFRARALDYVLQVGWLGPSRTPRPSSQPRRERQE